MLFFLDEVVCATFEKHQEACIHLPNERRGEIMGKIVIML